MREITVAALSLCAILGLPSRSPGAIERLPSAVAGFVGTAVEGPLDTPTPVESWGEFLEKFGGYDPALPAPFLAPSVRWFFDNGGGRCHVVRVAEATDGAYLGGVGPSGSPGGLRALREVDEITLVAVPGITALSVQGALISHCEELRDRVAILDAVDSADPDAVRIQRQGLRSAGGFAVLYAPWVRVVHEGVGELLLPPSAGVAGLCARIDREGGPWDAPVGEIQAAGLSRAIGEAEASELNSLGISVLRSFPGRGTLVWGARTISEDAELRYVPVRRLLAFLEESLDEGTRWAVFEPNDEPLWSRLRGEVEDFLLALWRDGAFQGATPRDAFFVRCDRSTMTEEDLDRGRTVLLAGVAPLRPAEFMLFEVVQDRSSAGPPFVRGDANGDGALDVSDAITILGHLFLGTSAPGCLEAADSNASGAVDLSDAVFGLAFLFVAGPPPPRPFPACGTGSSPSALDCAVPPRC